MHNAKPFKWRHCEADIIALCVRWYLRYALSYRDLEEMMRERGLHIDHTTIFRWVQRYTPELEKRCQPHLKACNDSRTSGRDRHQQQKSLVLPYRAVDSEGNTIEFLLSPMRDAEAATRFFCEALYSSARSASQACPVAEQAVQPTELTDTVTSVPRMITVDKNAAYPKAVANLKAVGALPDHVELPSW